MNHRETIVDQFTQQAVPFSNAKSMAAAQPLRWLVEAAQVTTTSRVLDVACGPGLVVSAFAPAVAHVTGIDVTSAMIERARELVAQAGLRNVDLMEGDAARLPFPAESFDAVVTRFSLHHVEDPLVVVKEMRRVCRRGGVVVVCDGFASDDVAKAVMFNRMETLRDPSTVRFLTLAELRHLFVQAELEERSTTFYRVPAELEALLAVSFPPPGADRTIREMFHASVATDAMGLNATYRDTKLVFSYPAAILTGTKP